MSFDLFSASRLDLPLILAFSFAAVAAGAIAWALWIRRTMAREAELMALVRQQKSQLEEANRRLEALSYSDSLTGVANRRAFDEALDTEWRRGIRSREPLSVLLIDVDHFKAFNDHYGHQAGDKCLAAVASALPRIAHRAADRVARYGGEEFGALLPGTDSAGAALVAERMRAAVEGLAIAHAGSGSGRVTISAGYATVVPGDGTSAETLIAAADAALYDAKRSGRNRTSGAGMVVGTARSAAG